MTTEQTLDKTTETIKSVTNIDLTKVDVSNIGNDIINFDYVKFFNDILLPYGIKILLAILILIMGRMIAKSISKLLGKITLKATKDEMLQSFVKSMSYFLLLLMVVIGALSQIGFDTTSLVALIGAAGLAIGLALQNSLQNFAAGVMILIFKPFFKGDFIETSDASGVVEKISLFTLEMKTGDNKTIIIPNGKVYSDKIINYSKKKERRVDIVFGVGYDTDLKLAKEVVLNNIKEHNKTLLNKDILVAISNLGESSIEITTRYWVKTEDYWSSKFEMIETVKNKFDENNIEIPYNKLDLYIKEKI